MLDLCQLRQRSDEIEGKEEEEEEEEMRPPVEGRLGNITVESLAHNMLTDSDYDFSIYL